MNFETNKNILTFVTKAKASESSEHKEDSDDIK